MRSLALLLALGGFALSVTAQPPDAFGEPYSPHIYMSGNLGQFADYYGEPMPEQKFKSFGNFPEVWSGDSSTVNFVFNLPDTLVQKRGRIRMRPSGELANPVNPEAMHGAPGYDNFYYPWCATGIVNVPRHYRTRHKTIFPLVDLQLYSTPVGLRMALVCEVGFNADELIFEFNGQDSLQVDVEGELRSYLNGRYLKFPEAIAFQLDQNNDIVELPWGGEWSEVGSTGTAKINLGSFDTTLTVVLQIGPPPMAAGGPENLNDGLDWSTSFGADGEFDPYGDQMGGSAA